MRSTALALALLPLTSGCIFIEFGEFSTYEEDTGGWTEPVDGEAEPTPFATYSFALPDGASAAGAWSFDRTQRRVGGLLDTPDGLQSATLTLSTPTGGTLADFALSTPWEGDLTAAPHRVWLDDQPIDWAAWRGEDAEWLGLRGIVELTLVDDLGTAGMDAWVGDDRLVLTACGDGGLRAWTVDFAGTVLTEDFVPVPGDRCAVLAPFGGPMVLLGQTAGGPLTRYRLVDGALVDPMDLHDNLPADAVAAASAGDMALMALADGRQIGLWSAWGETRRVAWEDAADHLVVDVLFDGRAAVAWTDAEGTVHAHWGTVDAALPGVTFDIGAAPLGLAVGLRDEVVSIASFDGKDLILARQLP